MLLLKQRCVFPFGDAGTLHYRHLGAGVHRKPSRDGQYQSRPLSETIMLHSELVVPMQNNTPDGFISRQSL